MSRPSDMDTVERKTMTAEALVLGLMTHCEKTCQLAFPAFLETLENESVEHGISEETLTTLFVAETAMKKTEMYRWYYILSLTVGLMYFFGRSDKEALTAIYRGLQSAIREQFKDEIANQATEAMGSTISIFRKNPYDAYQTAAMTFLSMIGYLHHDDSSEAATSETFLNTIKMGFALAIPFVHSLSADSDIIA